MGKNVGDKSFKNFNYAFSFSKEIRDGNITLKRDKKLK